MNNLTAREKEVLHYVCKGYNNVDYSPHTAKAHVKSLLKKFKVKNRTHLAYLAGKSGFTDFENS
jgi:DNA-binding CsgD family transcriptional regulator